MNELLLILCLIGGSIFTFFMVFAAMLGWKGMFQFFFQPNKYFNENSGESKNEV